ncbi:MAG TPA: helix-turn-helix transcriptional regulator, partial [Gemmatimonadales bacterium]|nr:helix-turn-helix transcriptional regulator [Gemmatimonadales bacterium]
PGASMPRHPDDPDALRPLKPIEALLLTMLAPGDRHGYGLRQDILDHTGGKLELEAGTLYRHLRHLDELGLLAESDQRPADDDDERRIYYRLTPFGRRVLAAEMQRLRALLRLAESHRVIAPRRT